MIAAALSLALVLAPSASAAATPESDTVTVFANSASAMVFSEPSLTSTVLKTLSEGDVLEVVNSAVIVAGTGNFIEVAFEGTSGYIPNNIAIETPTTSLGDLTETFVVAKPDVGGGAAGQGVIGSPALRLLPAAASTAMVEPEVGDVLTCAPDEVAGPAGVFGDVQWFPCVTDGDTRIGYVRAEWVVPFVDLADVAIDGSTVAQGDTPVYATPSETGDPIAIVADGTRVKAGVPTGDFTPVEFEGQRGYAPTKILGGVETLNDRIKEKATEIWGKTKEVASDAKDKVEDAVTDAKDKVDENSTSGFFSGVRDLPALIVSLVLGVLALVIAFTRRVGFLPLPHVVRRWLPLAASVPTLALAATAPITSYAWLLWIVLGVTSLVAVGVFRGVGGKHLDLTRAPQLVRERKTQLILGATVVGGAFVGALVTGFSGWLAPLASAVIACAAVAGYLLSAPIERTEDASSDDLPATPAVNTDAAPDMEVVR